VVGVGLRLTFLRIAASCPRGEAAKKYKTLRPTPTTRLISRSDRTTVELVRQLACS
jgi:hypothetical protein